MCVSLFYHCMQSGIFCFHFFVDLFSSKFPIFLCFLFRLNFFFLVCVLRGCLKGVWKVFQMVMRCTQTIVTKFCNVCLFWCIVTLCFFSKCAFIWFQSLRNYQGMTLFFFWRDVWIILFLSEFFVVWVSLKHLKGRQKETISLQK